MLTTYHLLLTTHYLQHIGMSVQAGAKKNGVVIKCAKQFVAEEKTKVQRSIVSHHSSCRAAVRVARQQADKGADDTTLKKMTWNCHEVCGVPHTRTPAHPHPPYAHRPAPPSKHARTHARTHTSLNTTTRSSSTDTDGEGLAIRAE